MCNFCGTKISVKEFNDCLKITKYSFRVSFKPNTFRLKHPWIKACLINSEAIAIKYFSLRFIPLSRKHQYSKLRG